MSGPLKGIRVLDLSRVLAGPWAGQILADMGAGVIKVERPGAGDDTRGWGPPFLKDRKGIETAHAAYFLAANRGKQSIAIDITTPEGQEIVTKLARQSDIVIENFKTGKLADYGLDYQSLSRDHPGLIYCSITGFGQTGPYKDRAGYDFIIQGMGGLMSITGEPGGEPQKAGTAIADLSTGMYAVIAILGALHHRSQTGDGQFIDMALLDVQVSWLANQNMNYLVGGTVPERRGNAHPNIVPYQAFSTKDGHIIVAVGNDRQFARYAAAIGQAGLSGDPRFVANEDRVRHRDALIPVLAKAMAGKTTAGWMDILEKANIPCGPINTIAEMFDDPQVKARQLKRDLPHPVSGTLPQVVTPIKYSKTEIEYRDPPPLLGQHTDDILRSLGFMPDEIERFRRKSVIE